MALILNPPAEGRILLHSCCAPCSGAVLECMVRSGLRPVVFFSNSNIVPFEEYELRKAELRRYCESLDVEAVDDVYDHASWLADIKGLEHEPERGARCCKCFRFRLLRAAEYARDNGFSVLATTLASSRWKDLGQVNAAGEWACRTVAGRAGGTENAGLAGSLQDSAPAGFPVFWAMNWRKGGLQPRRSEIIREQHFYNQTFCGCEFSFRKEEPQESGI